MANELDRHLLIEDILRGEMPPGWNFTPSEQELVTNYLLPHIRDERLPPNLLLPGEVYRSKPERLTSSQPPNGKQMDGNPSWFFLSTRYGRKEGDYSKIDRRVRVRVRDPEPDTDSLVHVGSWMAAGSNVTIDGTDFSRMALAYYTKAGVKTDWLMQEYYYTRADDNVNQRYKSQVNCKIYRTTRNKDQAAGEGSGASGMKRDPPSGPGEEDSSKKAKLTMGDSAEVSVELKL